MPKRVLVPCFALTLFVSASLLFWCQPMVGKMVLPLLGGAASVWTTCILFFQTVLLAGYVYAHLIGQLPRIRTQITIHAIVLLVPLAFLPMRFNGAFPVSALTHPATSLLLKLLGTAGIPFFAVSATAPLLQKWLSLTNDPSSRDPYFLYAASNAGSLMALLSYPFLVEPRIGVSLQSSIWLGGYITLILLIGLCVVLGKFGSNRPETQPSSGASSSVSWGSRLSWVAAAFIASGLMLAVTNHISSDLASAPFVWILPLAVYLLTFIAAFAPGVHAGSARVSRLIPVVLLALFPAVCAEINAPPGLNWILIGLHLILLYAGALLCHTRLAESRPDASHLTEFYFWIAAGGVLGGFFTATLAPLMFRTVLEYPILVAALAFLRRPTGRNAEPSDSDWHYPAVIAIFIAMVWTIFRHTNIDSDATAPALAHTILLAAAYKFKDRPLRFALTLSVYMAAYTIIIPQYLEGAQRIYTARNFFGVKKVLQAGTIRTLMHGDTTHGNEDLSKPGQPLSYYYEGGSIGDIMTRMGPAHPLRNVGVVGLGTGTMAAYTAPNRHITFFDIDPQVEGIARSYFSFLGRCGNACEVVDGDGRLMVQQVPDRSFNLLLLDAFSSDAIPTHLVSREALQLYLMKLAPDGIIVFHVSNRYLDVEKLVENLLLDSGLIVYQRAERAGSFTQKGRAGTNHVVGARRMDDLGELPHLPGWRQITAPERVPVWTDDYSSLLEIIRWH